MYLSTVLQAAQQIFPARFCCTNEQIAPYLAASYRITIAVCSTKDYAMVTNIWNYYFTFSNSSAITLLSAIVASLLYIQQQFCYYSNFSNSCFIHSVFNNSFAITLFLVIVASLLYFQPQFLYYSAFGNSCFITLFLTIVLLLLCFQQ